MTDLNHDPSTAPVQPCSPAEIERRVIEVLCERTQADPARAGRETRLFDLGDSLENVEALMALEDEFELSVPDGEAEKLLTVGQLVDYIVGRCQARAPSPLNTQTERFSRRGGQLVALV